MQTDKKLLVIVLALIIACGVHAQENYVAGYIMELDGDTLDGYVDYRNWGRNPNQINFRRQMDGRVQTFHPPEIRGFGVQGERYISAVVETEVSPIQIEEVLPEQQPMLETDTAFLQTMVGGPKSLYYYKDEDGKEHFYIGNDGDFELLIYKKYSEKIDGDKVIKEIREYQSQLRNYLRECPSISDEVNKADYWKGDLEKVLLSYYECTDSKLTFHKKTEKIELTVGVLAGLSSTSLSFSSDNFAYLVNAGYTPSLNFAGGLSFDVIFPRNRGKWSLNNELLFSSYQVEGKYEDIESENKYTITSTQLGFAYLKVNNMIRYRQPLSSIFLFFNLGISNGFAIGETNELVRESKLFSQVRTEEEAAIEDTRKLEQALLFGVGGQWNRYSAELRYERGNGMSKFSGLSSTTNRFYFLLGYRF